MPVMTRTKKPKTKRKKTTARKAKPKTASRKATSRSRAAPKRPRRPSSPKALWAMLQPRLDKVLGELRLPQTDSVLEKAVYLILREGGSPTAVSRAMKALQEEFIDWNEVRASRPSELARMLSGSSNASTLRKLHERVRRVKDMIDQIYNDRNDPSLEFVLEMNRKDRFEYIEDLDDLGLHNACALAQWLAYEDKLAVVTPAFAKGAQKLGLSSSAAMAKAKKELSSLGDADTLVVVQAHVTQLGEMEDDWPSSLKDLIV